MTVLDGWTTITSLSAAAGQTTIAIDDCELIVTLLKSGVAVSAVLSARFVKRATPPETVAVVVQRSGSTPRG
jgi:hypothetical protein